MNGGYFPPGGGGGSFDPHSPGPIGDVTPGTVAATSVDATGNISGSSIGATNSTDGTKLLSIHDGYGEFKMQFGALVAPVSVQTGAVYSSVISLRGTNSDALLLGISPGVIAQRNGTNGQTFSVYATFTDTSNYSRFSIDTTGGFVNLIIDEAGSGSGTLSGIGGGVTGTAPTGGGATSGLVATTYIGIDQNNVLYTPAQWLTWKVGGTNYKIPLYV